MTICGKCPSLVVAVVSLKKRKKKIFYTLLTVSDAEFESYWRNASKGAWKTNEEKAFGEAKWQQMVLEMKLGIKIWRRDGVQMFKWRIAVCFSSLIASHPFQIIFFSIKK